MARLLLYRCEAMQYCLYIIILGIQLFYKKLAIYVPVYKKI